MTIVQHTLEDEEVSKVVLHDTLSGDYIVYTNGSDQFRPQFDDVGTTSSIDSLLEKHGLIDAQGTITNISPGIFYSLLGVYADVKSIMKDIDTQLASAKRTKKLAYNNLRHLVKPQKD